MSFLLDESDTVLAYENKGKTTEQERRGGAEGRDPLMSALDNLGRVQQLEIIHGTWGGEGGGKTQARPGTWLLPECVCGSTLRHSI